MENRRYSQKVSQQAEESALDFEEKWTLKCMLRKYPDDVRMMWDTYKLSVSTQNGISSTEKMEIWNVRRWVWKGLKAKSTASRIVNAIQSILKQPRIPSLCLRSRNELLESQNATLSK